MTTFSMPQMFSYIYIYLGNGPSAIILSYFLSGHWPYYNGKPIDDPILKDRLKYMSQNKSLVLEVGAIPSRFFLLVSILFIRWR